MLREGTVSDMFVYGFDEYGEYEDIAPCKYCGGEPYNSMSGISCRNCGYTVERHGRTNDEVLDMWNADPDDGERAPYSCDVEVFD
jgi:ribosomal protein L37E